MKTPKYGEVFHYRDLAIRHGELWIMRTTGLGMGIVVGRNWNLSYEYQVGHLTGGWNWGGMHPVENCGSAMGCDGP